MLNKKYIFGGRTDLWNGARSLSAEETEEGKYSDEDLEKIMFRHASKGQVGVAELRQMIRENPLLVGGLLFTLGLLLGVSYRSSRKR
jgi:hypothetical protein